jgi:PhnB protein
MDTLVQPYLFFAGNCEEAVNFYSSALGAQVEMIMRYKDSPEPMPPGMIPPGFEDKVMHSSFRVGGNTIMASDNCHPGAKPFGGFSISLSLPTVAEVDRAFHALSEGGKVDMALDKTFWSSRFGMLTDKFGVAWMIGINEAPSN